MPISREGKIYSLILQDNRKGEPGIPFNNGRYR